MAITVADIKALREKTGAGMMDVKKALTEAEGDTAKAEEILRLKGLKVAAKREGRTASNGLVLSHIGTNDEGQFGLIVEVNAETDFVAKNEKFIAFAEGILAAAVEAGAKTTDEVLAAAHPEGTVKDAVDNMIGIIGEKLGVGAVEYLAGEHVEAYMHKTAVDLPAQVAVIVATDAAGKEIAHDVAVHVAAMSPAYLAEGDVPEEELENERRIATELTIAEGKPEQAVPKIVEGRLKGYFKQVCLLDQPYARDPKHSVGEVAKAAGATITGFKRVRVGQE
ncbi:MULTISPECIES: translation elongation factor Ts [Trueperella]|uniref:Elongation factor Ts n=1 Tax=Trueperella bernardiae TaxID=59561 RepID=A0A0W1KL77_9ACTO|nr:MULTISPECIES: translation elongation factor Ts [Trueperella]KTF04746.1 Elongation factor Ts [Trueperella bernardiae]MCM3907340.1 translation elongation factor Ts [Trueperella bernardiae]MDK8601309.1 translation elongation factor Ts [Trueperella bernardiae]MDV6238198.1 translation elongation factor Ts [Trueperella bernardiae]OCW61147.1 elongation factor Ts [Trueperella bernardiae]